MARAPTGIVAKASGSYQAWVWSPREKRKIYRTFPTQAAAKAWRSDASVGLRKGTMRAPTPTTLRQAADAWLDASECGEVLSRKRQPYKPSTLRGYRADLRDYVYDDLGARRLADVTADDLQALVDRLVGSGLSGQRVRNIVTPLQSRYRRHRRQVLVDPTRDLDLPEPGRSREWTGTPRYVAALLAAVPDDDRAIWGCAFYAGLRLGELRALRVSNVGESSIRVEHGWDPYEGEIDPKSKAGVREVPVPEVLRVLLDAHANRTGDELLFGRTPGLPFTQTHIQGRADEAWAATAVGNFLQGKGAEFDRVTFHAGATSTSRRSTTPGSPSLAPTATPATRTAGLQTGTATCSPASSRRRPGGSTSTSPVPRLGRSSRCRLVRGLVRSSLKPAWPLREPESPKP
jgi:integrase